MGNLYVMPAEAGIQADVREIPASAGMTENSANEGKRL